MNPYWLAIQGVLFLTGPVNTVFVPQQCGTLFFLSNFLYTLQTYIEVDV